jgi:inosine-uridine nucleoside N-ribohydrolase
VDKARLIVMGGCIGKQEQGEPGFPEYNVKKNPKAAQKAYGAGWDVTMTPIDTAGKVVLEGEYYGLVRDAQNPVARLLMEQYRSWNAKQTKYARDITRSSSILWDTIAIYLAFDDKFCRMRDIRLRVTDEGITKPAEDGKLTHVAIEWKDLDAFYKLLAQRIANYRPRSAGAIPISP